MSPPATATESNRRSQPGSSLAHGAAMATACSATSAANSMRDDSIRIARRGPSIGQDPLHDGCVLRLRCDAVHQPGEDIRVLAGQQVAVLALLGGTHGGVFALGKGHQHEIELEHAATAMPVHAP